MNNTRSRLDSPADRLNSAPIRGGEFPSARYFQTHFEYLYERLTVITQELAVLKQSLGALESSLQPNPADAEIATKRLDKYRNN